MATTSASSIQQSCSTCRSPASLRCPRYVEGLNEEEKPVTTYYCNKKCQKASWASHKSICSARQARKQLFRAGHLVQAAFLEYRRKTFDMAIAKVEKRGQDIHLWAGVRERGQMYMPFPEHLIPNRDDQQAVLVHLKSRIVVAHFYELMTSCLYG